MEKIKLGIIGMSQGNGHPYSWAAICNGFNAEFMKDCPFPVIPQYLTAEKYPEAFIKDAEVTHIWTQERRISEHIARASRISNIVDKPEDMIGHVDAVLLARDDAENHLSMARSFLQAGLMIYIDKPLAFDKKTAAEIYAMEQFHGQIFSCSAMRYGRELDENMAKIRELGKLSYIAAITMKRWDTYSAHIIDPVLRIIDDEVDIKACLPFKNENTQGITLTMKSGLVVNLSAHMHSQNPIEIRLFGEKGNFTLIFKDTFYAFRGALEAFIQSVKTHKSSISRQHVMIMVDIIERGND